MWNRTRLSTHAFGALVLCAVLSSNCASLVTGNAGKSNTEDNPMIQATSVRYQVKDVERSIQFYTQTLGFRLELQAGPAFARVSIAGLDLLLSGPGSSGARRMPDGREQSPGGWNRIVLHVADLDACIGEWKASDVQFRNAIETGPGGKQAQIEDPDGNPIELFEPAVKRGS